MVVDPTPEELAYQICEEMQLSAAKSNNSLRSCLLSQLPNMGLTQSKTIKVVDKKMGRDRGKSQGKDLSQQSGSLQVVIEKWDECGGH